MQTSTRISNDFLAIEVSPLGAELQSVTTADGRAWLWNGDAAFWTGRSPILFPIVGKAPDDTVLVDGKSYSMPQHGLVRRRTFDQTSASDTDCRFELTASDETRAAYPFDFALLVDYILDGSTLTVAVTVENRGDVDMPFGFGFHPAFLWPLPGADGKRHRIVLANGAEPPLIRLDKGLLGKATLPSPFKAGAVTLDHAQYDADAMIFPEGTGTALTYEAEGGPSLNFTFNNLPNLALWTKPGAPYICIEPWHGMAAELDGSRNLKDRPYTTLLPPGQEKRFAFSVTFPA